MDGADAAAGRVALRWTIPAALLAVEYLGLSLLVDFPTSGPAIHAIEAIRLAVPVAIGAAVGGWLLARRSLAERLRAAAGALPPWRPLPPLGLHVLAFAATAALAHRMLGPGAPPLAPPALLLWCAAAGACVLLALASAAPLGWMARLVARRWRLPLLSVGIGLVAWWAAALAERTWGTLSSGTLRAVAWLLQVASSDVSIDPAARVVGAGGFDVVIAPVCSGVNGVGLVLVFQTVWMFVSRPRLRLPRAWVLLPLGAAAALAANVARIAGLILVGAAGHEDLALGGFHSKLGWVLFVPIALGTIALGERLPWFRRDGPPAASGDEVAGAAASYVAPLVAALATALATGLWSDGALDPLHPLRGAAAALALWLARRSLPPVLPRSVPLASAVAGAAVALPWIALGGAGEAAGGELAAALAALGPAERLAWIAARIAASCLVLPVAEELAFRGFLLPALVSPDFERAPPRAWTWPAVLLSSAAFGALHESWLLGTAAGCVFAAARLWRGRLSDAIAAHALCNAAIAAAAVLGGRWELWA